jgi:hypothetical protein
LKLKEFCIAQVGISEAKGRKYNGKHYAKILSRSSRTAAKRRRFKLYLLNFHRTGAINQEFQEWQFV